MPNFKDLTSQKFGRLTVVKRGPDYRKGVPTWECVCECGNTRTVRAGILTRGESQSCGCLKKEIQRARMVAANTLHGMTGTRTHRIWCGIVTRCTDKNSTSFKKYGAKGITISARWEHFENFYADMGNCPDGLTIDRIDNSKGYESGNCRWASMETQQNNRTNNHCATINGVTKTLAQWQKESPVCRNTIRNRLNAGWDYESAIFSPSRR